MQTALASRSRYIPWLFVAGFALVIAVNGTMIWFAVGLFSGLYTPKPRDRRSLANSFPWSRPQANSSGPAFRSQLCATSAASAPESPSALLTWLNPALRAREAVASPTANSGRWRWLAGRAEMALPLVARMACTLADGGNGARSVRISSSGATTG